MPGALWVHNYYQHSLETPVLLSIYMPEIVWAGNTMHTLLYWLTWSIWYLHATMIQHVVTRSSTHNVRIERLWRDVYQSATSNFIAVFSTLENKKVLDTIKKVDMYCIDYILCHIQTNVWVNFNRTGITTPYPLKDLHTSCLWKASKLTIFCLVWNIAQLRPEWFGCHDNPDDRLPLQRVKYCTLFCNKMLIYYRSRTGFNCESLNCEFF